MAGGEGLPDQGLEPEEMPIGAVVQLNSGGPEMTVMAIEADVITCAWFSKDVLQRGSFPATELHRDKTLTEMLERVRARRAKGQHGA
jgi:uncharacterized protein YodC (DUF2158 family)